MKKLLFTLALLVPGLAITEEYEPDFLDNYYIEEVIDDLAGVFYFCQAKKIEYEKLMKDTKKTHLYLVYRAKRDAYLEMLEYIKEN